MEKLKRKALDLKTWALHHKKPLLIVSIATLLIVIIGSLVLALRVDNTIQRTDASGSAEEIDKAPKTVASPLSGQQIPPALAKRAVTAVVYNNYIDARPQSGLLDAGVVHEALAEADITRLVAFFQENKPDLIGPIRSLRPYFNDWALQYDAAIAHVGGSAEAIQQVDTLGIKDMDQFYNGDSFWRSTDRVAPHNVYTSTEKLDALATSKGYTKSSFTVIARKKATPLKTAKAKNITIDISSNQYNPSYTYSKKTNSYNRALGGAPHTDRESKKVLSPKVVIVIKTNTQRNPADGRYTIPTTGTGEAIVFQDGNVQKGSWTRSDRKAQISLKDLNGKKIPLNPGQAWYTYIDSSKTVTYE